MDADEREGKSQPVVLSYRPRASAEYARGSPPHVRAVAAAAAILLMMLIAALLVTSARERRGVLEYIPAMVIALIGAFFFAAVAAGLVGRHRRDPQ